MSENKFAKYFSTDMSSIDASYMFFSLCDNLTIKELEELKEAYRYINSLITRKEMRLSSEGWLL